MASNKFDYQNSIEVTRFSQAVRPIYISLTIFAVQLIDLQNKSSMYTAIAVFTDAIKAKSRLHFESCSWGFEQHLMAVAKS